MTRPVSTRRHRSASVCPRLSPSVGISLSESDPESESEGDIYTSEALRSRHTAALRAAAQEGTDPAAANRFIAKIVFAEGDACWEWKGRRNRNGYGEVRFNRNGRPASKRAHRVSWAMFCGPIPDGVNVLHRCDNPPCVRPSHLWTGTQLENNEDRHKKGRTVSGDRHGMRLHPETVLQGSQRGWAKLREEDIPEIRSSPDGYRTIAARYGVCWEVIRDVKKGRAWRHAV